MREQILNLLGTGASQEDVLKIVGCSKDLIAELLTDKTFVQELRTMRDANRQELIEAGYAKLEQTAINSLTKDAAAGMLDTKDMCRVLEVAAKNRILYRQPNSNYANPTVHLSVELKLPQAAQHAGVTIDQKSGQILAIGERSMQSMPIQGVQRIFRDIEAAQSRPAPQATQEAIDEDLFGVQHGQEDATTEPVPSARAA